MLRSFSDLVTAMTRHQSFLSSTAPTTNARAHGGGNNGTSASAGGPNKGGMGVGDTSHSTQQSIRKTLVSGIYPVLALCSDDELQNLFSFLPPHAKTMFKTIHTDFLRDHKFTGKV
eukprot:TRINITY_DN15029_c0_g1::TRINITY_DN15029_c0_g1_i1::g.24931::m.24931 TRINITY_DN15029_c0_g1::TRINITY_DN15029_c0_g1_i1::g.24931  ORF type:complete len:116 (-),score=20.52,Urb2/PF10441.4/6.8e+02,Urb2/PF10441.4/9.3e-09 TRINITY_DN15029_c0_g1_i1:220-567(-)